MKRLLAGVVPGSNYSMIEENYHCYKARGVVVAYFVPRCSWEILSISFAYIVPSHVSSNDFDTTITAVSAIPF